MQEMIHRLKIGSIILIKRKEHLLKRNIENKIQVK